MELVPERLKGCDGPFRLSDCKGNVIVAKDKRTPSTIRDMEKAGLKLIGVPDDTCWVKAGHRHVGPETPADRSRAPTTS